MTATSATRYPTSTLAALLLLLLPVVPVDAQSNRSLQFTADSEVTVSGTSTIHDWSCTAQGPGGRITLRSGDEATVNRLAGGSVNLRVERLECERSRMNDNTWEALDYRDHPQITFELTGVTPGEADSGWTQLSASGNLTIAGATRQVELSARARDTGTNQLRIQGEKDLTMSMFEVERPSAVLGTIKAADEVTVTFDVRLAPATSSQTTD